MRTEEVLFIADAIIRSDVVAVAGVSSDGQDLSNDGQDPSEKATKQ